MFGEQIHDGGNEDLFLLPSGPRRFHNYIVSQTNRDICHEPTKPYEQSLTKMRQQSRSKVINTKIIHQAHRTHKKPLKLLTVLCFSLYFLSPFIAGEYIREFQVSEGVPIGTKIGFIGHANPGHPPPPQPPYLIVPVPSSGDVDLRIEEDTGEIKTKVILDRELRSSYSFVAIPHSGENIKVVINVKDENDNAPTFPEPVMHIPFPENTPRDAKKTLAPAIDKDLGMFNTQRYVIVSGNINNAFRLSSHREDDGVLYLDLQVNGFLDRETTEFYSLVIEAWDEGNPPLKGSMIVNITIQDMNDNQPIFNQSRYFATILENATIGTSVLQVLATDTDAGDNGKVTYSINRRQSDRDYMFQIDPKSGVISVNRPLDFESKEVHELVVVAKDSVDQPYETTAFVSIRVIDVNDNQPTINLIFLSDDVTPKISEDAQPGEYVARISVNDPDSKEKYANVNVTLEGGTGHFGLETQDSTIYLMVVSKPLDREVQSNFTLVVVASDQGSPPLHASREFKLQVTDVNDNEPEFEQIVYNANVLEVADPGTSVYQISAIDKDNGNNSAISYSIRETSETHSNWFQIDSANGLITTKTHIDCETDPQPLLTVIATDAGSPPQSSSTTVRVTIMDVNDNEPIFDQSFYNVSVQESEAENNCVLKVSATDPDCGVNAMVNYSFGDPARELREFKIRPVTGDICVAASLDYETRRVYEFPVVATDRGGLSTTAMVKIQLTDINDNRPVFYPAAYNVSLKQPHVLSAPFVVVVATDRDSGVYGQVVYEMVSGNDEGLFRLNERTGEIFVTKSMSKAPKMYLLKVAARDGAGLTSRENAVIAVSMIDESQKPPVFRRPRYSFNASESSPTGTPLGTVSAASNAHGGEIRYSIYSGDPGSFFKIDPRRGVISTARLLDHESVPTVLLNVLATHGDPPTYGHTQVNISVKDVNDNAPEFDVSVVKISVPENAGSSEPIYAAHATDPDSGQNGRLAYRLIVNPRDTFSINHEGILNLRKPLDFESTQRYGLVVEARDGGDPALSSNLTINIEVQDVNDNAPAFQSESYTASVSEETPVNSEFLQVQATDADTGNNARLTYSIEEADLNTLFGVFPNSGALYLKKPLDREQRADYAVTVVATDNGMPARSSSTSVSVSVLDENDNAPAFGQQVYEFTMEENVGPGAVVGSVRAADPDLGTNSSVRYTLHPDTSFAIHSLTGEITTRGFLDREFRAVYEVELEAVDGGSPPMKGRASLRVLVTDVNDNEPVFVEPADSSFSIREDQPVGSRVFVVRATDKDEGNNASIVYSLAASSDGRADSEFFDIDASGLVTTTKSLDRNSKRILSIVVRASDQGTPQKFAQKLFKIHLRDRDETFQLMSSSFSFEIDEGVKIGTEVGRVLALDDGSTAGRLTYTIHSGNTHGTFDISRVSGQIFTANDVDFEMLSEYDLKIKAVDSSSLTTKTSSMRVNIKVIDINDQVPTFLQDPILFSVRENLNIGSKVWNFTAIDRDSGLNGKVKYSLIQQSPKKAFRIEPSTGIMTLMTSLDAEEINEFLVVVAATDQPTNENLRLRSSVTARIVIEDQNDNAPTFISKTSVDVSEDVPIGYPVLHVIASDEDSGENGRISYAIANGNEEQHFHLDPDTGLLVIAKQLDRESKQQFILNLTADDNGKPRNSASQIIKIFVLDVNDNPPKFNTVTFVANVSESSPPGTFVTKVSAIDRDLGSNGNLTFIIPDGIGDNKFRINPVTGEIKTIATLDREEKEEYSLTVYVKDGGYSALYDTATVRVTITDINDHAPEFRDSCYPLRVPENTDLSLIHTVLATDKDTGHNGEVTYSIIGGDAGHKFNIDSYSGQLSSKPLDRESNSKYFLIIAAEDRGEPFLRGFCNITITVEDQNDNDPLFSKKKYMVTIPENTPIDTTVVKVQAVDRDQGENSKITFSLNNETQWLFKVDNLTGVIMTAGKLDRERQSQFLFEVRATDGGKYDSRSTTSLVEITVSDINDNLPIFDEYPFRAEIPLYHPLGREIIQIRARDQDTEANARITYSLTPESMANSRFRIDPDSGVITAVTQLTPEDGQIHRLGVVATDGGRPPQSSTGLVEIRVGDTSSIPTLQFRNSSYSVIIEENAPVGTKVAQISAFRTDGRRQSVSYFLDSGNEYDLFELNAETGLIRVRDSWKLDFELNPKFWLSVHAETIDHPKLVAYSSVLVELRDINDNPPKFTQDEYIASVWEGNSRGTYVVQISATDPDEGTLRYDIIDGNHDNAFVIEPPFSGIVKTNIVLDREIRDAYSLTVIASDEGKLQLTGTCTLRITVVDVNDNQPTFPPHSIVEVSESAEVGTLVTTITANDIDTHPPLTYAFAEEGNPNHAFAIDKFSGKILLAQPLDHENIDEYQLKVEASDTSHVAETRISVRVSDANDNAPSFSRAAYAVTLSETSPVGTTVAQVTATDADKDKNAAVVYRLVSSPSESFYVDRGTGAVITNSSLRLDEKSHSTIPLVVEARDGGRPSLVSLASVRIHVNDAVDQTPRFSQQTYKAEVREDAAIGYVVTKVNAFPLRESSRVGVMFYSIAEGDEIDNFRISGFSGELSVVKPLDREKEERYLLTILASNKGNPLLNSTCKVEISIVDVNDNAPLFDKDEYIVEVSESLEVGQVITRISATDKDSNRNAKISYDITSGNEREVFALDSDTGVISLREPLDFDTVSNYRFIVRAADEKEIKPLFSLAAVYIKVKDENDNAPHFPVERFIEFVAENVPIGSSVFTAHANDLDKGVFGRLNYSIPSGEDKDKFHIDATSGVVTNRVTFDYEVRQGYYFIIKAVDAGGKSAVVNVQVNVESRDEFAPVFTKPDYYFAVGSNSEVGDIVGQVSASDKDGGPDGRVFYSLRTPSSIFKINRTTGHIIIKRHPLRNDGFKLEIEASSDLIGTLKAVALVKMNFGGENTTWDNNLLVGENQESGGLASWAVTLLVALIILLLLFAGAILFLYRRNQRSRNPKISDQFDTSFDTIATTPGDISQYPPRYNDLPHYNHHAAGRHAHRGNTTSEMSEKSQSTSSGRGSADNEDVEDEEIRMINERPLTKGQNARDGSVVATSSIVDEDNISDVSVRNTQEYLARLGIDPTKTESSAKGSQDLSHNLTGLMFDHDTSAEPEGVDLSNLIYSKLNEVSRDEVSLMDAGRSFGLGSESQPSMTGSLSSIVHSEEELQGSYNWDYLLDWGPQYQPLAHVFSEIARLKDDSVSPSQRDGKKPPNTSVRNPPPLLTSVAPRPVAPVVLAAPRQPPIMSSPRSPISHDAHYTPHAMSPSFSPALSPLATRSPSISPMMAPGVHIGAGLHPGGPSSVPHRSRAHFGASRQPPSTLMSVTCSSSESELRI